ncbi:hypothetical protein JCM8547_005386 [Rhodosporidiobolus lusitaniae]
MADDSRLATPLEAARLLAPVAVGYQLSFVFYGLYLCLHVAHVRSRRYRSIHGGIKAVVWLVFFLLAAYEGLCFADSIQWTITVDRRYQHVSTGPEFESYPPLFASLVATSVQALLSLRVAALIKSRRLKYGFVFCAWACILLSLAGGILVCAANILYWDSGFTVSDQLYPLDWNRSLLLWLIPAAVVDSLISLSLALTLKAVFSAFWSDASPLASANYVFFSPLPPLYAISLYSTISTRQQAADAYALDDDSCRIPGSEEHGVFSNSGRPGPSAVHVGLRSHSPHVHSGGGRLTVPLGMEEKGERDEVEKPPEVV